MKLLVSLGNFVNMLKNIQTINLCIIHPLLTPGISSVMDYMKLPSGELCSTSRSFRLSYPEFAFSIEAVRVTI
jgi:hypothetical protein